MDLKIELLAAPVPDIDRAKDFSTRIGFHADVDTTVDENIRFVQLTPTAPRHACASVHPTRRRC